MKIDYRKLVILLLPTFLRGKTLIALLQVMVQPIQELHDRHQLNRELRMYELQHTGQVCHLKDALNREFRVGNYSMDGNPDYAAGFDISDNNAIGNYVMVYDEEVPVFEQYHLKDSPLMVHDMASILPPTESFTVLVPRIIDLSDETYKARIRGIVNKYKLASRTFTLRAK